MIKYAQKDWIEAATEETGSELAEFAITLLLASPSLRNDIISELYRTCERAGMRPPYWSPPHLKLAAENPIEVRGNSPTPPDRAA